ncbi:ribosomal RNA large subunit methyltransferase J, partial [Trifolium medium]|nr:ribosomal RNA large subunit methyltransferase J [Trifolium medium]
CLFGCFLYLRRAGHKLEGAIEQLGVDVAGKVALDSGLSTGGFTDCLLQYEVQVPGKGGAKVTWGRIESPPSSSHISF